MRSPLPRRREWISTARRLFVLLALAVCAAGCGDDDETCDPESVNVRIRELLDEWHLYPDQLSDPSPGDFAHPADYLRAVVEDVDLLPGSPETVPDVFTVIIPAERLRALFDGVNEVFGFRMSLAPTPEGHGLFVADVFGQYPGEPPSPASEAGLQRGFEIRAIDGVDIPDLLRGDDPEAQARLGELLDRDTLTLDLVDPSGQRVADRVLHRASVETRSVALSRLLEASSGRKVAYIHLRDFLARGAFEQLRTAFAHFAAEGARSLVLDLRYNGGGDTQMADFLGSLVAGRDAEGAVFRRFVFNAQKSENDEELLLAPDPPCPENVICEGDGISLEEVEHVVAITTRATASASETVISGLEPHLSVSVIGSRTGGKPVGMGVFRICDWAVMPVAFRSETALGPASYFDGIPPACEVGDDLTRAFGDPEEAMLAAALHRIETGECPEPPALPRLRALDPPRLPGWGLSSSVLDAHGAGLAEPGSFRSTPVVW